MANQISLWDFFREDENQKDTMVGKIKEIGESALELKDWSTVARLYNATLTEFSKYLGANEFQTAAFIATFYYIYFRGDNNVTSGDIADFFATKQIMILQHKSEFMKMRNLGLMKIRTSRRSRRPWEGEDRDEKTPFSEMEFLLPESVVESIVNETELKKDEPIRTPKDFLHKLNKMLNLSEDDEFYDFYEEVGNLESECEQNIEEIKNVKNKIGDDTYRILFYLICLDTICSRRGECNLSDRMEQIVESSFDQKEMLKNLISSDDGEEHWFLKTKLVELNEAKMAEDTTINATNEGIDLMFGKDAVLYKKKNSADDVITSEKIVKKELFFSGETKTQLDRLYAALEEKKFAEIQDRLSKKGMTHGIASLLYGAPGTGKTESVYQLAKDTNRDIYHVDMSQTKTMWYGESPKRVKKIFSRYKDMCKSAKSEGHNIPILLLNEADALISTRKNVSDDSTSCDKEDNTIQNVLLEEMEKIEGILIATTNLATNMDSAFERRFLFKVEFKKPDADGRAKIWRSKIGSLSEADAKEIASDYDFSGGEIDNITRKMELEEVISGVKPDVKKIRELCRTEKIVASGGGHAIGFAG